MSKKHYQLGIIGGGQLARMMIPTLNKWDINFSILDQKNCVCAPLCRDLKVGDFQDHDSIVTLMNDCEVITYDLESISLEGLEALGKQIKLRPSLALMHIIQDKGKQKDFFKQHRIPSSHYRLVDENFEQLPRGFIKLRKGGYDGKGVLSWKATGPYPLAFKKPIVWEEKVDIEKEISILVVRNQAGDIKTYKPVDMVFNHDLNLIDYTLYPAQIEEKTDELAKSLAIKIAEELDLIGIMAVELFITKSGELLVNELAPRPHNSGHHTIESHHVSQFENHLRAVLDLPLGEVKAKVRAALTYNLLGKKKGKTHYLGLEKLLAYPNVHVHLYGKSDVKVGRKMGHVTITGESREDVVKTYHEIRDSLIVTSKD